MHQFCRISLLLCLLSYSSHGARIPRSDEPRLIIRPSGETQRVNRGKDFVFNCLGENDASLFTDLKWTDPSGKVIQTNNDFTATMSNRGEKAMLVIKNPTEDHAGVYTCSAVYQGSKLMQTKVNVQIVDGITFTDCPNTQALIKGNSDEMISCHIQSSPAADISWYKGDINLNRERFTIDSLGVRINGPTEETDAGDYVVVAVVMETGQVETMRIIVETHIKPVITDLKEEMEVVDGEKAILYCTAKARPSAQYSWFDRNRRNLSKLVGYSVDGTKGTLIIDSVNRETDRGAFTCVASNEAGQDQRVTEVKIITKPSITRFDDVQEKEGGQVNMKCEASGYPVPTITIRREGEGDRVLYSGQSRTTLNEIPTLDGLMKEVTIVEVQRSDSGLYYCLAENAAGKGEMAAHLQVNYRPDVSRNVQDVKSWAGNRINVTCTADAIPNATIHWYKANSYTHIKNDGTYNILSPEPGLSILQVDCTDRDVAFGDYRCEAQNILGSADVYIKLRESFPPDQIKREDVEVVKKSPQTITFSIKRPYDGGIELTHYWVNVLEKGTSEERKHSWPVGMAEDDTYLLENLQSKVTYQFSFYAQNAVGEGPSSPSFEDELPSESQPDQVHFKVDSHNGKDIHSGDIESRYSQSFTVSWDEPASNGRQILMYEVRYFKVKLSEEVNEWVPEGESAVFETVTAGDALTYNIKNLKPSAHYRVEVCARNSLGISFPSYLIFKTASFTDGTGMVIGGMGLDFEGDSSSERSIINSDQLTYGLSFLFLLLLFIFLLMDVICCCAYDTGILYCITTCGSGPARSITSGSSINKDDPDDRTFTRSDVNIVQEGAKISVV